MVFWGRGRRGVEHWISQLAFKQRKELRREVCRRYHLTHKGAVRGRLQAWRSLNTDKVKAQRLRAAKVQRAWRCRNSAYLRLYQRLYQRTRRAADFLYGLKDRLRTRTAASFREGGLLKRTTTEELLGCSWARAKAHIEKQFVDGMSWDNRDLWHIDHIIPLSTAYDEYTLRGLCHFTNLRPLWIPDNLSKGDSYPEPEYVI